MVRLLVRDRNLICPEKTQLISRMYLTNLKLYRLHLDHLQDTYNIRTFSANIKFIYASLRNRQKANLWWAFLACFADILQCQKVNNNNNKKKTNEQKQKQPPNFLNRVEAIVVLIVLNCILCDARTYTATVLFNYRSSIWIIYNKSFN